MWELTDTVQRRPPRKAPGIDGFPRGGLRPLSEVAGGKWLRVLNMCLQEGVFSKIWKKATIVWSKPGSQALRLIHLLPIIGKVLSNMLAARFAHHLEKTGRINKRQFGFRRGRGTIEALRRVSKG